MKIVSVKAKNFRSYESLSWLIPQNGITLIDGENLDTGRSNMTGKSSCLDSVFWCLYGYLPKWGGPKGGQADAVIRRGEKKCWVRVVVEHGGRTYEITRNRPTGLTVIDLASGLIQGKTSDLDQRIPDLIGMTAEQFLISVYVSQDRQSSFFTMSDTERAKLLSVVAKLDSLNKALDNAKEEKVRAQAAQQRVSGSISTLEESLSRFPSERKSLEEDLVRVRAESEAAASRASEVVHGFEEVLRHAHEGYEAATLALTRDKDQKIEELNRVYTKKIYERTAKNTQLRASPEVEYELIETESSVRKALEQAEVENHRRAKIAIGNDSVRKELGRIADSMSQDSGPCSECGQSLPAEKREAHIAALLQKAERLEAQLLPEEPQIDIAPLKIAIQEAQRALILRRAELDAMPKQLRAEIATLDAELQGLKRESELLESNLRFKISQLGADLEAKKKTANEAISSSTQELQRIDQERKRIEKELEGSFGREKVFEASLQEARALNQDIARDLDEIADLIDLFGPKGFRSVCYDGLIERISDRAGQLLALMTDDVYSTRIEQTSENSKGEEKMILKPVITKGGLVVPMDDLSGGARRMAMLAYDVAVSEAVGDSSALFLDEALDGLDPQGKAEAMRLLEEVAQTRAVFLVDHTSELKSACQSVIRITYRDGVSRMEGSEAESEEEPGGLVRS